VAKTETPSCRLYHTAIRWVKNFQTAPTRKTPLPARSLFLASIAAALAISSASAQSPVPQISSQQATPSPSTTRGSSGLPGFEPQTGQTSSDQEAVFDLPSIWTPTAAEPLPAPPPALAEITIPEAFIGCWKAKPSDWDYTYAFNRGHLVGSPGEIETCYSRNQIDFPRAEVEVTAGRRILDLLFDAGLAYHTFTARAIRTDLYGVSPTRLRGRTTLTVEYAVHSLLSIVARVDGLSVVDWSAELVGKDDVAYHARLVLL